MANARSNARSHTFVPAFASALRVCGPALLAAVAACSTNPSYVAHIDTDAVARYRAAGFAHAAPVAIESHRISGPLSEAPWTISLVRPADHGIHPLIVFLPGLGQSDDTPNHWTETWARAGYAVITIQALGDDADVWATPEARSGDFERIARARFADDLMADRLSRLSALLNQVRKRSLRGEHGLENIDWSKLALAGADLGAYTVQTVEASPPSALAAISWPLAPKAFIALSPYAVRQARPPDEPPRDPARPGAGLPENAPTLMVSSRDDVDAYGVVSDPSVRRLAYDRLAQLDGIGRGQDFFLELGTATHRWLCGQVQIQGASEPPTRRAPMMADEMPDARKRRAPGVPGGSDAMAPGGLDDDLTPEKRASLKASREELERARSRVLTHAALSEVSVEDVSVAFLDRYVRDEPQAGAWLMESAQKWLQDGDRLKVR